MDIKEKLNNLHPDLSNIGEVYNSDLKIWCGNKPVTKKRERDFIISERRKLMAIDYKSLSSLEHEKRKNYIRYLREKQIKNYTNEDYYNDYLKKKYFGFLYPRVYKRDEYNDFKEKLKTLKTRYDYIINKLSFEDKEEFKHDFCDQLEKLKERQKATKFKAYISDYIVVLNKQYDQIKANKENKAGNYKKPTKSFFDFIHNVEEKENFANALKNTFKTEKGIEFKILIELLKEEKVFLIGSREFSKFYRQISTYFDRDIGSRTALNDLYRPDKNPEHKEDYKTAIENIKIRLNPLITKYKTALSNL